MLWGMGNTPAEITAVIFEALLGSAIPLNWSDFCINSSTKSHAAYVLISIYSEVLIGEDMVQDGSLNEGPRREVMS